MAINVNVPNSAETLAGNLKTLVDAIQTYVTAVFTVDSAGTGALNALSAETATVVAALNALITGDITDPFV
jgi:hypothetical protein